MPFAGLVQRGEEIFQVEIASRTPGHIHQFVIGLLKDPDAEWEEKPFFIHFARERKQNILDNKWQNSCVRQEKFKLVNGNELYDISIDPGEQTDISEKFPEKVTELRELYTRWFEETTSERGLKPAPNILGHENQTTVNLFFFEKNQVGEEKGWPLDVVNKGPYTVAVEYIQHDMFSSDAKCIITVGETSYEKPILKNKSDIVFENVYFPLGENNFQLEMTDIVNPKKWRYGLDDYDHRLVRISKEKEIK